MAARLDKNLRPGVFGTLTVSRKGRSRVTPNPTVLPATLTGQHYLLADDTPRILAADSRQRIPPTTKLMQ